MIRITSSHKEKKFEGDLTLGELAREFGASDALLAESGGRLYELSFVPGRDMEISFLSYQHKAGRQTYERTALFLLFYAFERVLGEGSAGRIRVEFSTGNGLYLTFTDGFLPGRDLLRRVEAVMKEASEKGKSIIKRNRSTEEAVDRFRKRSWLDKEKLLSYRRASTINIYSLEEYEDYFYGYMAPETSYIRHFSLLSYEGGFILMLPDSDEPQKIPPFFPSPKVFSELSDSSRWAAAFGLSNVGDLNDRIAKGQTNEIVLVAEAYMEKTIGDIAQDIVTRDGVRVIMIAGPTSSGKTTFSHRLAIQLQAHGLRPHIIEVDNYFKNREDTPRHEDGSYNFETIEAIDIHSFNKDLQRLLGGERVELPSFNFKTGLREYRGEFLQLHQEDVLILEGIHCLNDRLTPMVDKKERYKIYISALTTLNIDDHNRIPTTDGRLLRRMVRDARTRGCPAVNTLRMWHSVRQGEEKYIFPFQDTADTVFNSITIYELAVLKQYAEPLLFGIPRTAPEHIEAKRLLKFLDYILGIPADHVPANSVVREFIGGSCFKG